MNKTIILFGGTTEGRQMAEFLSRQKIRTRVCTATAYGGSLLRAGAWLEVSDAPLTEAEMEELFRAEEPKLVIDSTHPYATEVTRNIRCACEKTETAYVRLLRDGSRAAEGAEACGSDDANESGSGRRIYVDSVAEAVAWLQERPGKVLAVTGSKELDKYTALADYQNRVVCRVLSTAEAAAHAAALGFQGRQLLCMQGPFSREMNEAILRQYDCRYMVTKASGQTGGFAEKLEAAENCGCTVLIVGRPPEEEGLSFMACKALLCRELDLQPVRQIALVGIGMGRTDGMTGAAVQAISEAELLVGAKRMLEAATACRRNSASGECAAAQEYDGEKIAAYLQAHPEYERVAVLLSGDIGFYSGARKLLDCLPKMEMPYQLACLPGISSLSYFMGRLGKRWDDAVVVSHHGQTTSLIPLIRDHEKVFAILGRGSDVRELAQKLCAYGLTAVRLFVGERLSYAEEKLFSAAPEELTDYTGDALCVVLAENPQAEKTRLNPLTCRKDEEFLRDRVPMTKEEVRTVSIAKLNLTPDAVCYDVGAGTGSVSVEMAIKAGRGQVFAIEKKPEAVSLLEKNKREFCADNLQIVCGLAPEALAELPAPTHVFIGGSSGNMEAIVQAVREKNPAVRIVINCIALESVDEAVRCAHRYGGGREEILQLAVSRARQVGAYTMMNGENPITIVAFGGARQTQTDGDSETACDAQGAEAERTAQR